MSSLRLAVVPVVGFAVVIVIMLFLNIEFRILNMPYLVLILNSVFITGTHGVLAIICARGYLKTGSFNLLLLGSGLIVSGSVSVIAGLTVGASPNYAVTTFNIGMVVFSTLQLLSAFISRVEKRLVDYKIHLIAAYSVTLGFVGLISSIAHYNLLPTFMMASGSPTLIRQVVLTTAIVLLSTSSLVFYWRYTKSKSIGLYWYSLAVALFAIGLIGVAIPSPFNDIYTWIGRFAQYTSGLYFLLALVKIRSQTIGEGMSEKWSDVFSTDKEQSAALFANMLNGFVYAKIVTDRSGKAVDWVYLDVNDSFERIFGLKKSQVIGKTAGELFADPPDDIAQWLNWYSTVALTGKSAQFEAYRESIKKWLTVSAYSPKKGYFISILEDITSRKKVENELRRNEERFRNVFERTALGIVMGTIDGKVIECNPALERMIGYSNEELTGKSLEDFTYPEDLKLEQSLAVELFTGKRNYYEIEKRYIRKDKQVIWVHVTVSIIYEFNGQPWMGVATIEDISERKKTQNELEHYSKNLETLVEQRTKQLKDAERLATIGATAGMVGHDIRNPLQAITGDLYLAKSDLAQLPMNKERISLEETVDAIERNVEYIAKIVADLQDYAKVLNPHAVETDLSSLIQGVLQTVHLIKEIELSVRIEPDIASILTEPSYVKRIVYNLVWNATQAMPTGGRLSVNVFRDYQGVVIAVSDTGIGIPDDVKPQLFTPLFTTKSKGQGFGLVVVKRLTEALGGSVSFESQIGQGTTFQVRLPQSIQAKDKVKHQDK